MIIAGDAIDKTLCVAMGFSSMAAAALGNTLSDVAGVFSGSLEFLLRNDTFVFTLSDCRVRYAKNETLQAKAFAIVDDS